MILGIVLARMLDPAVFGNFVAVNATLMFLMIPASFSTAQLLVSDAGKTPTLFSKVMGMVLMVALMKFLLLASFVIVSIYMGNPEAAKVGAIVGIPMVLADWVNTLKCDLEGRGFFKPNFLVQIADLSTHTIVAVSLVWHGWGIYGLALGGLAGFIPQAMLYILLSDRRIAVPKFDIHDFTQQFRTGFWLWLGSVASNWYLRVDKILLGNFAGATQLGYYNRAMNYGPVSHVLLNSLMTNATIRALSTKKTDQEKIHFFLKTAFLVIFGSILNGAFWYVGAPTLVPLIFGNQWIGAIPAFQILGWLGAPYFLVYGSSAMLYSKNKLKTIALVHAAGIVTLVTILLIAGLSNYLDYKSSSWIFLSCMFFTGLIMSFFSFNYLFPKKKL